MHSLSTFPYNKHHFREPAATQLSFWPSILHKWKSRRLMGIQWTNQKNKNRRKKINFWSSILKTVRRGRGGAELTWRSVEFKSKKRFTVSTNGSNVRTAWFLNRYSRCRVIVGGGASAWGKTILSPSYESTECTLLKLDKVRVYP